MDTRLFHSNLRRTPQFLNLAVVALSLIAWSLTEATAFAQQRLPPPNLLAIFPAGAQVGSTVDVEITSQQQLEGATRLVFSHPGITAKQQMRPADRFYPEERPIDNKFVVTVAGNVPPGIYEVRAGGRWGLSNPRRFAVGKLSEILEVEDNNTPEKAQSVTTPILLNGLAETSQVDYYWIEAGAGETLVIEAFSERLDARGDLALALYNSEEKLLARSLHVTGQDPVIPFTAPAAGKYLLRVYEVSYNNFPNAVPSPYRVAIDKGPWIDFIEPPIAQRGQSGKFTLYGKNLGPGATQADIGGRALERLEVSIAVGQENMIAADLPQDPLSQGLDWFVYRHKVQDQLSNPVRIALADSPLVPETEANDSNATAQRISWPAEIHGHFDRAGDIDWYAFEAKAGDELWIEIDSQRLGPSVDPLIVVERVIEREGAEPQVRELTTQDDLPAPWPQMLGRLTCQDASWLLKVTDDGLYRIMVRDQFNTAGQGPAPSYRLRVRPPRPDFRLLAFPGMSDNANGFQQQPGPRSCTIPNGGSDEILIVALRRDGFAGPIEITPSQLPTGMTAEPVVLGAESNACTLIVRASGAPKQNDATLKLVGKAKIDNQDLVVPVVGVEQLWNVDNQYGYPARLTEQISVSLDDALPAIGRLEPTEKKVWRMSRGGKLEIPIRFVKSRDDFGGSVTLGAIDLPENNRIRANQGNLSTGNPNGKLELDIQTDATLGEFTFVARGEGDVDYRRNLELFEQATADKARIEKVSKELTEAYQQSQRDRQKAEQDLSAAQQKRGQAEQQRNQAQQRMQQTAQANEQALQRVTQSQEQVAAAEKKVAEAKAQIAAAGDDNAKQQANNQLAQATQQLEQAQNTLKQVTAQQTEAADALKKATDELAKAMQDFKTSETDLEKTTVARAQAQEAEKLAQEDTQLASRMQQEINNRVNQTNNVARQQKVRLSVHSDPIRVEIVPYPITAKLNAREFKVKAGEPANLAISVAREFGFDGEVTFQLQGVPNGVRFMQDDRIKQGQNEAQVPLLTDRNTKEGTYSVLLTMRMTFNGRGLDHKEEFQLVIEPAPPEEKK